MVEVADNDRVNKVSLNQQVEGFAQESGWQITIGNLFMEFS